MLTVKLVVLGSSGVGKTSLRGQACLFLVRERALTPSSIYRVASHLDIGQPLGLIS